MKSTPATLSLDPLKPPTQRMWRVALGYFALAAVLGALLRFLTLHPVPGLHAGHLLHTHSHIAFLGWVFNACFVLGLTAFPGQRPGKQWRRLWVVLQVGVIGMLVSYPIQGYGPISIAFSTLHMGASAVFAWWLWRATGASTAARPHLRVALAALVLSGLGPLALGPLAALDLRDSPGYTLAIYFYLHAHYNGWFVFFLQAIAVQAAGKAVDRKKALRAAQWLAAGLVLTFAQSTLWLDPPSWVRLLAGIGGGLAGASVVAGAEAFAIRHRTLAGRPRDRQLGAQTRAAGLGGTARFGNAGEPPLHRHRLPALDFPGTGNSRLVGGRASPPVVA